MVDFTPTQRGLFIALCALALGATGLRLRSNSQPPPVAFVSKSSVSPTSLQIPSSTRSDARRGGASLQPSPAPPTKLVVHVAGAVKNPGVYELGAGKRIHDAIRAAGGAARHADLDALNLAARIGDGQQIRVPRKGSRTSIGNASPSSLRRARGSGTASAPGIVNINTASAEELDTLPGVGPSTAQKIIEHRDTNGPFTSPEGMLEVKGIGPKKLAKMRPYLTVR